MRSLVQAVSRGALPLVLVGLATSQVRADDAQAAPSSHHFSGIWYRTPEKRGVLAAWLASGDLTVGADTIVFESTKLNLTIPSASVSRVFDSPLPNGGGIEWIVVEYDDGGTKKAAAFRDGRMFKGDNGAVHEALFRATLSAGAAPMIAQLHTTRLESLYYTNESVPAIVWKLAGAPDLEDALLRAYASGDPDDLFRFNIIVILNRRAVSVKDSQTRQRMHDCMTEALRTDSFGWVKVEALDALRRLGDETEALAQADVLMKSDKDAAIHDDVAKWLKGVTTAPPAPAGVTARLQGNIPKSRLKDGTYTSEDGGFELTVPALITPGARAEERQIKQGQMGVFFADDFGTLYYVMRTDNTPLGYDMDKIAAGYTIGDALREKQIVPTARGSELRLAAVLPGGSPIAQETKAKGKTTLLKLDLHQALSLFVAGSNIYEVAAGVTATHQEADAEMLDRAKQRLDAFLRGLRIKAAVPAAN